eukprot:scaffold1593_cov193-Alexandrium_tamarense.AAC.116
MPQRYTTILSALILCHQPDKSHAFLPSWLPGTENAPSELRRYTNGQVKTILDVRLSIGLTNDALFLIDGFQFQLCNTQAEGSSHISLPGVNGPRPHLSSGAHHINHGKDGSFIDMNGLQNVQLNDGVWEMIWRDNRPAGLIVCGFNLEQSASRNDVTLDCGNVYMTFPVWSKTGLMENQYLKMVAQREYEAFEAKRNSHLELMKNTQNILTKALHFRNAAAATEEMDNTGLHLMTNVPSKHDVLEIGEGLQLVKTGTVWSRNGSFSDNNHQLLGSAMLLSK